MHHNLCKNCELTFDGNYCSNCGQKTATKRLDWNYVFDEIKYTFLHVNGGLLYTCKQLLTRPGDMTREFIEGKRIKHYKPILLVFVLAGISTVLMHYSGDLKILEEIKVKKDNPFNPKSYAEFINKYNTLIQLISIPIFSFCTWLGFKKWGYNYVENIIINSFGVAQLLLISIVSTPLKYLILNSSFYFLLISILSFLSYGFTIWLYLQLYKKHDLGFLILRMILSAFIFLILFIIICIAAAVIAFSMGYLHKP